MKNPKWSKTPPAPAASDNLTILVGPSDDLPLVLFKAEQQGRTVISMTEIRNPGPDQGGWRLQLSAARDTFERPRRKARQGEIWGAFSTSTG